jgi:hypothetical protein
MSGKPVIPEWQRASSSSTASTNDAASSHKPEEEEEANAQQQPPAEAPTPTEDDVEQTDAEEQHSSESNSLLEQAARFLDDPAIRDAPREKKTAFLESKGVSTEDIERLLGEEAQERRPVEVERVGEQAATVSTGITPEHCRETMLMHLGTPKTCASTRSSTSSPRNTPNCHIPRVPCKHREATASDYYPAPCDHGIHNGRSHGKHVRVVKVHHSAHDTQPCRVTA